MALDIAMTFARLATGILTKMGICLYDNPNHERQTRMKTTLPVMGRPSRSGLSEKMLGKAEYRRQMYWVNQGKTPPPKKENILNGISHKILGHARYMAEWRKLRAVKLNKQ